jgi:hypothetical protein
MSRVTPRAIAVLVLALLSLPAVAVPQVTYHCSSVEQAKDEFRLAMKIYSRRNISQSQWQEIIKHLQKATDLCPVPKSPIPPIVASPFSPGFSYIPFYFLGDGHFQVEERPEALRSFYLSSCFGEPKKDGGATEDLRDMTGQLLKQIVHQKRPEKQPPYFSEGIIAKEDNKLEQSAERMWDSMQAWPEDGETVIVAGRWPEPYVPRFHLASALYVLGCKRQACEQLAQSKLKELAAKDTAARGKYEGERKKMEDLETKCASGVKDGQNPWICQQWQCWLARNRE